ncbi:MULTISPECIES: stage II sporulation protein P [Paenibacillus]|uniref:Stage II sporulation protein P n=1 Tax=Paenibacillus vandeheii TaxID=3035917 RepID=A0ABT8JJM3_9BACL|nr:MULTISPECIES: stage II sporulation protein P [Paenibacillus]MDN4605345.1 stage II sporulation protein P [Paenibacillus vandeheii]
MARRRRRSKLVVFTFLSSFIISLKVIPMYIDFIPVEESVPPRSQVVVNNITSDQTGGIESKEITKLSKGTQTSKDKITNQSTKTENTNHEHVTKKPNNITATKNTNQQKSASRSTQPQILIYHTHNRESWLPELQGKTSADEAFDSNINVTLLGEDLTKKLTAKGMNVIQSTADYPSIVKNFDYAKSYSYSKDTLSQELSNHKSIDYVFDIHRDSQPKDQTTIVFDKLNYAQLYFVVGKENPNWKETMEFATKLQNKLNKKIPGISKGIYSKDHSSGNGKYNQSLAESSALIEIGGVENVLEENYRTISILADVIHQIWHEDHGSTLS